MKKKEKTSTLNQYFLIDKYWPQYVIIFCLIILISFLFPRGKSLQYVFQLNDVTQEPIIAPFTFPILKSDKKLKKDLDLLESQSNRCSEILKKLSLEPKIDDQFLNTNLNLRDYIDEIIRLILLVLSVVLNSIKVPPLKSTP